MLLASRYALPCWSVYEDDPCAIEPCQLDELDASPDLHVIKTHEAPPDDARPAILLVRDGRDAMVSYAHFIQDYGLVERSYFSRQWERLAYGLSPFEQILKRVIAGEYADWTLHYRAWSRQVLSRRLAVVKYEELVADPVRVCERALADVGCMLAPGAGALPDFAALHAADPRFFRSGESGQWRVEMRPELEDLFWRWHRPGMEAAGYS
ncbi:MAG: sulfotransferase domain-containing protein [Bryobacterales bacterium]|nr:sulfotransferase domain-containing protein [Bryobacterales bacterium]